MTKMELKRANGKGWILFGSVNGDLRVWFERWFETDTKALTHAAKKGWKVDVLSETT